MRPGGDAPIIWAMFLPRQPVRTATIILVCASLICALSLGIRHTFGLFMRPMTLDLQWNREAFSFAIALQNLVWGAAQPFSGWLADRYGACRVIARGERVAPGERARDRGRRGFVRAVRAHTGEPVAHRAGRLAADAAAASRWACWRG